MPRQLWPQEEAAAGGAAGEAGRPWEGLQPPLTEVPFLRWLPGSRTPTHAAPLARQGGSSHRHAATTPWLLPARLRAALLPHGQAGARTATRLVQLKIFNTCHTRRNYISYKTRYITEGEHCTKIPTGAPSLYTTKTGSYQSLTNRLKDFPTVNFVSLNKHF